ncbi:MAG: hypothetical protein BMS9Abin06_0597 [Gammaproteobacteria bacterium]|nr:MAG: hypothetical protein BMS9Abin06_0597 [Gammaproteobacteria bacterium]
MPNPFITYRGGYKYQLASDYSIKITIKPKKNVSGRFIKLDTKGNLTVVDGYAWDGPSGPVEDTHENMRASLVHDALYQLMRNKYLTAKQYKDKADKLFKKICIEDGVPRITAQIYYLGLKLGGKPSTDPKNKKKIHRAPR